MTRPRQRVLLLSLAWCSLVVLSAFHGFHRRSNSAASQVVAAHHHVAVVTLHLDTGGLAADASGGGGEQPAPTSKLVCDRSKIGGSKVTPQELDLQQQRRCVLEQAQGRPEGGYLAACLAVKDQHRDLPEWLEWHHRLGVSHFYIMDDHSAPPLDDVLRPYVQAGIVTHRLMDDYDAAAQKLLETTCQAYNPKHKQLIAYALCLQDYGARHQFMAFVDADEFLVLTDGTPDLPTLLKDYEHYGALAVNWRLFGSSGHKERQNNTLLAYTKCLPKKYMENRHIKTIANMAYMVRPIGPHEAMLTPGYNAVTTSLWNVNGPFTNPNYERVALHHYAVKSWQEFQEKAARGSGMSNRKGKEFWELVEKRSWDECNEGVDAWERLQSQPQPQPAAAQPGPERPAAAASTGLAVADLAAAARTAALLTEPERQAAPQNAGHNNAAAHVAAPDVAAAGDAADAEEADWAAGRQDHSDMEQ